MAGRSAGQLVTADSERALGWIADALAEPLAGAKAPGAAWLGEDEPPEPERPLKMSPAEYLRRYPDGPKAELAEWVLQVL